MTSRDEGLVHGMGTDLVPASWPVLTTAELADVLGSYPAIGTEPQIQWVSPRPFSAAAIVRDGQRTLFVKRHHNNLRTVAELGEEHRFMRHLRDGGLAVPAVLDNDYGDSATALGEWTYEVHTTPDGLDRYRDNPSWTPFHTEQHAHAAGQALAALHLAAAHFAAPKCLSRQLVTRFDAIASRDPLAQIEQLIASHPTLADVLAHRPWREEITEAILPWHERFAPYLADLAPLWTHNDWHGSNLLWDAQDEVAAVFDFGLSNQTTAIFDLATALERSTIDWLHPARTTDLPAVAALITGYLSRTSLSARELRALPELLPIVHTEFALSELEYFHGIAHARCHDSDSDADRAYTDYLIGHARWFSSPAGTAYLDNVRALLR